MQDLQATVDNLEVLNPKAYSLLSEIVNASKEGVILPISLKLDKPLSFESNIHAETLES